jgi:hypothetical protein
MTPSERSSFSGGASFGDGAVVGGLSGLLSVWANTAAGPPRPAVKLMARRIANLLANMKGYFRSDFANSLTENLVLAPTWASADIETLIKGSCLPRNNAGLVCRVPGCILLDDAMRKVQ